MCRPADILRTCWYGRFRPACSDIRVPTKNMLKWIDRCFRTVSAICLDKEESY